MSDIETKIKMQKRIAHLFKLECEYAEITQQHVANVLGIHRESVKRNVTFVEAVLFCDLVGIDINDLL